MTKWDKIIILVLIAISFVPYLLLMPYGNEDHDLVYAVVRVAGEEYQRIPLTGQNEAKEYFIETEYGENTLIVQKEEIAIKEADCPDQVCIETGYIQQTYERIVCLPNRMYIEVEGEMEENSDEVDIRSH